MLLALALAQSPTATLSLSGMFSTGKATLTADGEALFTLPAREDDTE